MKNHDEKIKDIAESLLPSTMSDAQKTRQGIHRRNRRRINQHLGRLEQDFLPEEKTDLLDDDHMLIREFMWDRRNADKLGAFINWAEHVTSHLEDDAEKYDLVKRLMPNTLIGRHALTHLPFQRESLYSYQSRYVYALNPDTGKYEKTPRGKTGDWDVEAIATALHKRIDHPGFHTKLNRVIKDSFRELRHGTHDSYDRAIRSWTQAPCTCRTDLRLLMGIHDIEDFAAFYAERYRRRHNLALHPEVTKAVIKMLS